MDGREDPAPRTVSEAALVSVDLDDSWAYLRARGIANWEQSPTVLETATDRLVPLLRELGIPTTVFVVGRDALIPARADVLAAWTEHGHEVGNHSLDHLSDLAQMPTPKISDDVEKSSEAIQAATGTPPVGFRGPSFGVSAALHRVLESHGYRYDATLLPSPVGPLLRLYQRRLTSASGDSGHRAIFGRWTDGFLPLRQFDWIQGDVEMREVPVTVLPFLRLPMHMSYIHAIASLSPSLAAGYLTVGLSLCRFLSIPVSFLVHPPDVLDVSDAPELGYLPGMKRSWETKVDLLKTCLEKVIDHRVPLRHIDYVTSSKARKSVPWKADDMGRLARKGSSP